nr:sensor histidine kinase [Thalassobacillus sp. CUG 92003]
MNSIRYTYIRSHLYGYVLILFILLSLLLSAHVWFSPGWLNAQAILFFMASYVLVGLGVAIYAGFKSSGDMKQRIDYISTMIIQLSRGAFSSKIYFNENDEIARIGSELNELGDKLKQQKESLLKLADEKAEYAKSAHKAATIEERQRLARDLHDAVSQQLFALTMLSQACLRTFDKNQDQAKGQLEDITQMALQAQTEMRALLLHLRPVHLSGEPLAKGIDQLIEELQQKCQIVFNVDLNDIGQFPESMEEQLFRVVQEALSNILRHANATEVTIELTRGTQELFLHIGDNGIGFDAEEKRMTKTSYGLTNMKERCEEIGGEFTIRSREDEGTHIDIRIPIKVNEGEEAL